VTRNNSRSPWTALWAMMVGRFMILVDTTVVVVANPTIMAKLDVGYDVVMWLTSAYLLAFTVPLPVAGRLGDRFGAKNVYLTGLAVFTAASLWCGLSGSIGMLIGAGHPADLVDDHPGLPPGASRCGARCVGRRRRFSHSGGAVGRWCTGRHAGLGVDLFRQYPHRHRRIRSRGPVDAGVAHPPSPI
jgi:MFS family permease